METETLSKFEIQALVAKYRRNTYGNVSGRLIAGLIEKGLVNATDRRLSSDGIDAVETHLRRND